MVTGEGRVQAGTAAVNGHYPVMGFSRQSAEKCGLSRRFVCSMLKGMHDGSRTETKQQVGLHVCPACSSHLVQPLSWEQAEDRGRWHLWRRCPECEWRGEGVHGEVLIDAYDVELDAGTELLARELKLLARENMERLVEAFAVALASDLIGAEDFA